MTNYINNRLILGAELEGCEGQIAWRSPSNIALIKYWGKFGKQLPRNPSVSFTLTNAFTDTLIEYNAKAIASEDIRLELYFNKERNETFESRVVKYFEELTPIFPFIKQFEFKIRTGNSFPHSAGIASSASSMSSLALGLCTLEHKLFGTLGDDSEFEKKASYVARLGSGSACRSIYSHAAVWGKTPSLPESNDEYAIPLNDEQLHPIFKDFLDDILIVSSQSKKVSSTAGHSLMENHSFAAARYDQAKQNMTVILEALSKGDIETFGRIVEEEALTLHALMMSSRPSYLLLEPNSLAIVEKIRTFRMESGLPVYFTIDAGPNIHLLYPMEHVVEVRQFITEQLSPLCEDGKFLDDHVGEGPEELI